MNILSIANQPLSVWRISLTMLEEAAIRSHIRIAPLPVIDHLAYDGNR
jgi:hypothetical protein